MDDRTNDRDGRQPRLDVDPEPEEIAGMGNGPVMPIVAIGASAGGLAALERVFKSLSPDSGAAYVVLQHLAPNFDSHMTELLGRVTELPVVQAVDRIELEPDHVYVMQPNKEMIVSGRRLLLTDKDPRNAPSLPIDTFLRSTAREVGSAAVAVILSGTGSDGTRGVREIKAGGGYVIVQSPDDAEFDGMPASAIATGIVDAVLDAEKIPQQIRQIVDSIPRQTTAPAEVALAEQGFRKILEVLAEQRNIDFSVYRRTSLTRRIRRRMQLRGVSDSEEYAMLLASDTTEAKRLFHDILIGVTGFFRDSDAFETLGGTVVGTLFSEAKEELRVWIAGCATGEEVYSIAMLLSEARDESAWSGRIRIFATDIHKEALRIAADGIYSREALSGLSDERLDRYFVPHEQSFKVADGLREMVIFAAHNVVVDAPFTQLDLICCRNVLIYLQPTTQARILALFHFGLRTGGLLFLGPSESLGKLEEEFDTVDIGAKIFQKRRDLRLAAHTRLGRFDPNMRRRDPIATPTASSSKARHETDVLESLVERSMPASFLLDESHRLVHCYGGAEKYFSLKPGRVSTDPLALLDGRLRTVVASLLERLKSEPAEQHAVELPEEMSDGEGALRVVISRLRLKHSASMPILVELYPRGSTPARGDEARTVPTDYVTALEKDLELARMQLQTTVEELEAANEELQATNEELVASNEELQSTNEELRSVNDELNSVNEEHQKKIAELIEVTEDLQNLLQTINVATLFLDQDLRVRRVNQRAGDLLYVSGQDTGRDSSLSSASMGLLRPLARQVLDDGEPVEKEIRRDDGRSLLVHVIPYDSEYGDHRGVVVTAVDITSLKRAESERDRLSEIVRAARDPILIKDLDGKILTWNAGAQRLYGYSEDEAVGKHISLIVPEERRAEIDKIIDTISNRKEITPFETVRVTKDGNRRHVLLSCAPMHSVTGSVDGVSVIALDITDRKKAEERAAIAIEQRDKFLAVLSHELRNPLMAMASANEILLRAKNAEQSERAKQIIARQVTQMSRLLEDTLDASRMRHDKIELHRSFVDFREVIETALDAIGTTAERYGVSVETELPDAPVEVKADSSRLQQVVVNLVQNSLKHSKSGQKVRVSLVADPPNAIITVRDEGSGIEPSALPHIFEPFYQSLPSGKGGGLGLGLSLAKAVTEAHGGEISARSGGIGKGAEFEVRIPIATGAGDTYTDLPRIRTEPNGAAGAFAVVLVDDDEASRESVSLLLQDAGYEVHQAGTGEEGLNVIESVLPSVAVIDIGLPDISGLEVARKVRESFGPKQVRLLALTGFGQQTDRESAMEAGFDMHLVKPIDFQTLEKVISYQASR